MEYSKLISVTGLGGLYELISSKGDGAIVRSLDDKSTRFVSSRVHNFSHLESIEVYTEQENVNLLDVLKAMQESSETLPSEKDAAAVKAYFQKVYPTMDFDRVYASDMKKMVKWFSILNANNVELKKREEDVEEQEEAEASAQPEAVEETVKPKASKQKKKATEEASEEAETEIKVAAKKATKKKTEEQQNLPDKKL